MRTAEDPREMRNLKIGLFVPYTHGRKRFFFFFFTGLSDDDFHAW